MSEHTEHCMRIQPNCQCNTCIHDNSEQCYTCKESGFPCCVNLKQRCEDTCKNYENEEEK